jgi:hypothetical protein
MKFLPADMCRCTNSECAKRWSCLRTYGGGVTESTPFACLPSWPACGMYIDDAVEEHEEEE